MKGKKGLNLFAKKATKSYLKLQLISIKIIVGLYHQVHHVKDLFFIKMKFYSYSAKNQHNLSSQKVHLSCNKKSSKVSPENRRKPRAA